MSLYWSISYSRVAFVTENLGEQIENKDQLHNDQIIQKSVTSEFIEIRNHQYQNLKYQIYERSDH